jgi:protein-tyrosine-phosphatase/DNA-binding transcriptional ArsR family regulator
MPPPAFLRLAAHPLRWRLMTSLARSDHRVRELASLVGEPQNLVSYHLRLLRDGGLVTVSRSSFDGRDTYYHLHLDRCAEGLAVTGAELHPFLGSVSRRAAPLRTVLFVCTGNSARSPIAEALLRKHTGGRVKVLSAGSHPRPALHADTVRVLREEFDVDVTDQQPRHLNILTGRRFDYVITLCDKAREVCPEFGGHSSHWSVPEPAGYPAFTRTAADIDARVRHLMSLLTEGD